MRRALNGRTIVVTGASSGIGRATSIAFARQGARVVLAARRETVLQDVADECRRAGGQAMAVPTDVVVPEAIESLARAAEDQFGAIDVWVNNAGTGVFGPYGKAPLALHRRTVEVNLLGAMYGAYAVLPRFLGQGYGTLINNISIGAWCPTPYAAAYTASKFGLRGFAASLRQELMDQPAIHVCSVFPAIIDTPGFLHGANFSGRRLSPGPLLYDPEDVARVIVELAVNPRDEVAVGWPARAAQIAYAAARRPTEWAMSLFMRTALRQLEPAPHFEGALMQPVPQGTSSSGGWRERRHLPSAATLTQLGFAVGSLALLLGMAAYRK